MIQIYLTSDFSKILQPFLLVKISKIAISLNKMYKIKLKNLEDWFKIVKIMMKMKLRKIIKNWKRNYLILSRENKKITIKHIRIVKFKALLSVKLKERKYK